MKKGLLIASLVLLFTCLGIMASGSAELIQAYARLIGIAGLGTFLVGAVYPAY